MSKKSSKSPSKKSAAAAKKAKPAAKAKKPVAKAKTKRPPARAKAKPRADKTSRAKAKPRAKRPLAKAKAKPAKAKKPAAKAKAKRPPAKASAKAKPARKAKAGAAPARPKKNVPVAAVWIPEWKQWGHGARDEHGKRTGAWTFWRANGSLQEESVYVDDLVHGEVTRYHPDGSVAAVQRHVRGVLVDNHAFLSDRKTDEQSYELPASIRSCRFVMDETGKWQSSVAFFDAEGNRLTYTGEPMPPRPSDVPEDAYPNDDVSAFCTGLFGNGEYLGIHRTWNLTGGVRSIAFINSDHVGVVSRDPRMPWQGHPLVAAAAGGDLAAVEELFSGRLGFSLGHEPGAALIAQLEGQPELARRINALPPGTSFAEPPAPSHPRSVHLPEAASYVPGLGRWAVANGSGDELPAEIRTWKIDRDSGEVTEVEISRFEHGRLLSRSKHDGSDERARVSEEEWFDERGALVRKRTFEHDDTVRERETLPSGEKLVRKGTRDKTLEEKRFSAEGRLVRVLAYDEAGRLRMDIDVAAQQGRAFDLAGETIASGAVEGDRRKLVASGDDSYDEDDDYDDDGGDGDTQPGQLIGAWTLASGERISVEGFALGAAELVADLLPLLARLEGEPPPVVKSAAKVPWRKLEGFYPLDPKLIPKLLWLISLDEPAAVIYGIAALSDAIYHQDTISELTGPVLRLVIEMAAQARHPQVIFQHVELLTSVLTRDYDLDAAHELKKAYRGRKGSSDKDLKQAFRKRHQEESYGEIWHALQGLRPAIERWLTSEDLIVAQRAIYLLALLQDPEVTPKLAALVRAAVQDPPLADSSRTGEGDDFNEDDIEDAPERTMAMAETAAFAMSLFPRHELPLHALRAAVAEKTTALASEAAQTLIRVGAEDELAIEVTLAALRNGDEDAGIALTLLPDASPYLSALLELLQKADVQSVYGIARAALTLALSTAGDHDHDHQHGHDCDHDHDEDEDDDDEDGEVVELPQVLREVLEALVANSPFWRLGGNAAEVLGDFGLPGHKSAIVSLLTGEPEEEDGDGIISAASGLSGRTVESWRDVKREGQDSPG